MFRIARSAFFALSFLSLQLSLFGGGAQCSLAGLFATKGSTAPTAAPSMAGMEMRGMKMASVASPHTVRDDVPQRGAEPTAPAAINEESDAPTPRNDQTRHSEHSSTGCNTATMCVFAAVITQGTWQSAQKPAPAVSPTLALRAPPTEGDAPDSPPPRA